MERLESLLLSHDSEVTSDGHADTSGRSSEEHTFFSSSSSGYWTLQTSSPGSVSAELVDSSLGGCSSCLLHQNVDSIVKPGFSRDFLDKASQNLRTSDFYLSIKEHASKFPSTESSRISDIASLGKSDTAETSSIVITSALPVSAVSSQKLNQQGIDVSTVTSGVSITKHVVILSHSSPCCVNLLTSSQLPRQLPATIEPVYGTSLVQTQIDLQVSSSEGVDFTKVDVTSSLNLRDESIFGQHQEPETNISDYNKQLPLKAVSRTVPEIDSSTFRIAESSSKSLLPSSLLANFTTSSLPGFISAANAIIEGHPTRLWNFDGFTTTSGEISSVSRIDDLFDSPVTSIWSHSSFDSPATSVWSHSSFGSSVTSVWSHSSFGSSVTSGWSHSSFGSPVTSGWSHSSFGSPVTSGWSHSSFGSGSVSIRDGHDSSVFLTRYIYDSGVVLTRDIYDSGIVPTGGVFDSSSAPADNNKKSAASNPPFKRTLESSQPWETSRILSTSDEPDFGILDTAQHSPAGDEFDQSFLRGSYSPNTVTCIAVIESLGCVSSNLGLHSQNREITAPEWLPSSQVVDITDDDISELGLDSRSFNSLTDHNLPSGSILPLSYHTHNYKSELLELSDHGTQPLSVSSVHVPFAHKVYSVVDRCCILQTDVETIASYSLNGYADEEFSTAYSSGSTVKDGSVDIVSTRVYLRDSSSVAERSEASDVASGSTEIDQLPIHVYNNDMETSTMSSTYLQPSTTMTYDSLIYYPAITTTAAVNKHGVAFALPVTETSRHDILASQPLILSSVLQQDIYSDDAKSSGFDPTYTENVQVTEWSTPVSCSEVSCTSQALTSMVFVPATVKTIPDTSVAGGGASSKQMPNFNTTIIIASASAVLAVVIIVIITIVCLRRKKRLKSSPSRLEEDDMWVDLYRGNSSHHMPLPSLTTFEMTDAMRPGPAEDQSEQKVVSVSAASSLQVSQTKLHKQVSSFQIKKPNPDTEQDLGLACPVIELEGPEGLGQAESWVKMTTSVSMTSLPTTELSYNTNITDYNIAAVGHRFRAVYAYKPVCKGEMALKEGELVLCKERDRNGWMFGSKPRTNQEGWFPAVYVDEISSDYELDFNCDIPETYDILESNNLHSVDQYWTGIEHTVCHSYESSVPGDLNLESSQTVTVLQTLANGWWFAVIGNRCGWIPGSYVEMIEDNSSLEVAINGDHHGEQHEQSNVSTESRSTTEGNIETQMTENSTDSEDKRVTDASTFLESEDSEKDSKQAGISKTALTPEAFNNSLKITSSTENGIFDKNASMEPKSSPETISAKSTVTPSSQVPDKPTTFLTENTPTIPSNSLSVNTKSTHKENKPGKSFRPVRPAPPPPKRRDSKVKKDITLSPEENKEQATVVKKPIILIQGKRPKLQKVLRGQLDDKQLNPMIKPSTRGFIPKPTVSSENRLPHPNYYKQRNEWSSSEHDHTNSSPSIADDFHSELMTLLGQPHETADSITPSHFRPLPHNDGRSSSRISPGSESDHNTAYPSSFSNHILGLKENPRDTKQNEIKHSRTILNNLSRDRSLTPEYKRERSLTPEYKGERSLTPEYKKEKTNSPILLTTGSLLQNVQRFHGALNYPPPPHETDKGIVRHTDKGASEAIPRNMSPHAFNVASRRQRTPTTVPPPKVPLKNSSHSSSQQDPISNHRQQNDVNKQENYEAPAPVTYSSVQLENTDANSNREDITDSKRRPSRLLRTDSTGFNRESLVVPPGTVSEIVHQINTQTPLQKELLQKLKGDMADA